MQDIYQFGAEGASGQQAPLAAARPASCAAEPEGPMGSSGARKRKGPPPGESEGQRGGHMSEDEEKEEEEEEEAEGGIGRRAGSGGQAGGGSWGISREFMERWVRRVALQILPSHG